MICKSTPKLICPFRSTARSPVIPLIIREIFPGVKRFVEHGFDDPSEADGSEEDRVDAFRRLRDKIKECIKDILFKKRTNNHLARALTI
jgi:protein-tyrosine-phosphatase